MALSQRLELRQSQSLVMTPQLMQAIKLLQLSSVDLAAYVDAELERNPLLERADGEDGGSDAPPDGGHDGPAANGDGARESTVTTRSEREDARRRMSTRAGMSK